MGPYCEHFRPHMQLWLIWLALADHKDCQFKFHNRKLDAKVRGGQSEDTLDPLRVITHALRIL